MASLPLQIGWLSRVLQGRLPAVRDDRRALTWERSSLGCFLPGKQLSPLFSVRICDLFGVELQVREGGLRSRGQAGAPDLAQLRWLRFPWDRSLLSLFHFLSINYMAKREELCSLRQLLYT